MKNVTLFFCLLILILLTSCRIGINPNDANPQYCSFSCIINTDGTGLMEFQGANEGIFTPDSQKLIITSRNGLFYRYFNGNIEQISNLVTDIERISPALNYVIKEVSSEGVVLCDLYGNNLTNVTNVSDAKHYLPCFSSDGNWLMSTYKKNNIYNMNLINLQNMEYQTVVSDTNAAVGCDYNNNNRDLYYCYEDNGKDNMYRYNFDSQIKEIIDDDSFGKLSKNSSMYIYEHNSYRVKTYNTISKEIVTIFEGLSYDNYSINIDDSGTTALIRTGRLIYVINLQTLEKRAIRSDLDFSYATLSPDGTKIYANYSRQTNKTTNDRM